MSFTPGPWEARWEKKGKRYRIFNRHLLCLGEVYYIGEEGRHGDGEANARLIAAAPEMYDLLQRIFLRMTEKDLDEAFRLEIDEVLTRIENGEEPANE